MWFRRPLLATFQCIFEEIQEKTPPSTAALDEALLVRTGGGQQLHPRDHSQ